MTYTLFDITYRILRELAVLFSGTATSGSATTLVDNIYLKDRFMDNYFKGGTLFVLYDAGGASAAPEGEWARVTGFDESTGQLTHETLTAAIAAGDRYGVSNDEYTKDIIVMNLNSFLDETEIPYIDTATITTAADTTEYDLPDDMLNDNIEVWIQRSDTADQNLWSKYHDWYISETAIGTAKKLIFNSLPPEPWVVKLNYWKPHPQLNSRTDKLSEFINIQRVVVETAYRCLLWKRGQKALADPVIDSRIALMKEKLLEHRTMFPIKKSPEIKLNKIGLIDNFYIGE